MEKNQEKRNKNDYWLVLLRGFFLIFEIFKDFFEEKIIDLRLLLFNHEYCVILTIGSVALTVRGLVALGTGSRSFVFREKRLEKMNMGPELKIIF